MNLLDYHKCKKPPNIFIGVSNHGAAKSNRRYKKQNTYSITQMQKTTVANQNNIDGLINNRSLETMNKSIKEDIAVSNSVINNRSLDALKEQKYDMAESISASLAATQHKL